MITGTGERDRTMEVVARARVRLRERAWKIPIAAVVLGVLFALAVAGSTTTGANDSHGALEVLIATLVLATLAEVASLAYYAIECRRRPQR